MFAAMPQLFADQAARTPGAVAVVAGEQELTYAQLSVRARRIAARVRELDDGTGRPVAVALDRGAGLVAALLGVMGAGAAYLPLDLDMPAARLAATVADAGVRTMLVEDARPDWLPAGITAVPLHEIGASDPEPFSSPDPDALAYVIYTSGSTGRPKGVMIPHRALTNLLLSMRERPGLTERDVLVAVTTVSFDIAALELFLPLITGARLVVADRAEAADPARLAALVQAVGGTVLQATPATWRMLWQYGWRPPRGFTVFCGGEALPADLAGWLTGLAGVVSWDLYGPTETTIWSSSARLGGDYAPVAETTIHVLDDAMRPSASGELYIGGTGLARGYLGRPGLTAERFVPDPFAGPGSRMYRTGDIAERRDDGSVRIVGRIDHQIKIRGHRVELGEIEAVLAAHPKVRQAVAHPVPGPDGVPRLAAYVVADGRPRLREHAAASLPGYMLPSVFVFLDRFPLTTSGKVDRGALPAARLDEQADRTPPRDEAERTVTRIWAETFARESVGLHEDFFDLGGHSLIAAQIMARLRDRLGVELSLAELLERPTPEGHAALARKAAPATGRIVPVDRTGDLPLSAAQRGLWFTELTGPDTASYTTHLAYAVTGGLDLRALRRALDEITARHDVLRTVFAERGGVPVQRITSSPGYAFETRTAATTAQARRLLEAEARAGFDLRTGPLMRVLVVETGPDEHYVLFHWHHIVFDGWSEGVFLRELARCYAGGRASAPAVQYADFAVGEQHKKHDTAYWRELLDGAPPEISPVPDRPRPAAASGRGAHLRIEIPETTRTAVAEISALMRCTPFVSMLSAFSVVLSRYTGSDDLVIGVPWAGRRRRELEDVIGFFVNTLALRVDTSGSPSVRELVGRVRDAVLGADEHQDVPFSRLVEELTIDRHPGRHPLFQVMFNLEGEETGTLRLPGLAARELAVESGAARFDLVVTVKGDAVVFEYATDLFDAATIDRIARHYRDLLTALGTASPRDGITDLGLTGGAEECVHDLVAAQARRTPEAVAVETDEGTLTYRELTRRANRLAHALRARGVRPDEPVAVLMPPGERLVVALLGVLKAGAAYLPLDPGHPERRRAGIIELARVRIVLTESDLDALPEDDHDPGPGAGPDSLAYVISTSGSTGTPKNVALSHRSLVNLIRWQSAHQRPDTRTAQLAAPTFDVSFQEIFITLAAGGQVVVAPADVRVAPDRLAEWLDRRRVETVISTPTMLDLVAREWRRVPESLVEITACGEPFTVGAGIRRVFGHVAVHNQYGPSETHCAMAYRCPEDATGAQPIGDPISGQRVYLLDDQLRPVPPGAPGEIFIGGAGVARGYLNAPAWTAERFLPDPFAGVPGARMYRSGDLARLRADGKIVYLGRADLQMKLRGVRIEPAEIEAAMLAHPAVRAAAVAVHDRGLVGYLVPAADAPPDPGELRSWLRERLPDTMIPSYYQPLPELPLTTSGKLDRAALPRPTAAHNGAGHVPPATAAQRLVAKVWTEVLELDRVGLHDDFFTVGGHSLLAAGIAARLRAATGAPVTVREVLTRPTVAALAEIVDGDALAAPGVPRAGRAEPPALSTAQRRLWFLDQLNPGDCAYQLPQALRIRGPLDLDALRRALSRIVARHEVLRTNYPMHEDEPVQLVAPAAPIELPVVEADAARLAELVEEESWRPFDLARGPVIRALVLRLAPEDHVLVVTIHHIASDGWSMRLFDRELTALYGGRALPPPPVQYADFAAWELATPIPRSRLDHWREELSGLPALDVPSDRKRPAVWDNRGGLVGFDVPAPLAGAARELARRHNATLFMVLFAVYAVVLARRSGQRDFAIGTPVAGRDVPEVESLIGCFVNTLVLRNHVDPEASFTALLRDVRQRALAGYAAPVPFDRLVQELEPPRDTSRQPLVDVVFVLTEQSRPHLEGLETTALRLPSRGAGFDLALEVEQRFDDSLRGELEYSRALFDRETAEDIGREYARTLAAVCADADLPLGALDGERSPSAT
ncbi:amino acid adenylation domain-containing protein [Spirillospora sp. CA-294931]|uniref:amino acid adenylation domain-containing protein n=1 Tax=Spirillospora sp. CA-294931 TaxID=3240042 RepID=UPI003D8E521F